MDGLRIDDKETTIMNLVHYFVTERDYNPVVVHGINDEIWLENMNSDYKIVRIVSKYIHNDEQLGYNRYRTRQITKKLRMKTLSFKMNVLSIYVNLGDNVHTLEDDGNNMSIALKEIEDVKNFPLLTTEFPDIIEKTHHDEKGLELLFKITDDINHTNDKKSKKMEKVFSNKKPIVTYILMGICIIAFLITIVSPDGNAILNMGANVYSKVREGEIWRIVTCMFLHLGITHIVLNMYSLYIVGSKIEDFFGKKKYLLIYFLSGLSGSLLSIGLRHDIASVGASGAIFGLFGALIYFGYSYRGYIGSIIRSQIVPIVIYNLALSFIIPGIDVLGHIGGLIGGVLSASMLGTIENKKYDINKIVILIIYYVFLGYLVFFR